MANYTTADIKALREKTGAGMLDVKKALDEANGDAEKAIEIIRVKGLKGIAKREGRAASAGLIAAKVVDSGNGQVGVLVEINAETDFVAKNQKFLDYAEQVLTAALDSGATDAEALAEVEVDGSTVKELTDGMQAVIGEKIVVRRVGRLEADKIELYLHRTNPDLPAQVGRGLLDPPGPVPGGLDEGVLDGVVDAGAEDVLEEVLALGGVGAQEPGELALRQDDRLRELLPA